MKIRAEDVTVDIDLDGQNGTLPLTTILVLLMAEVLDNPTFKQNLKNALSNEEAPTSGQRQLCQ